MAIGIVFQASGVTQAQYDQACKQVAPDNRLLPGMLYHAGGPTETGWCVIEVWESKEVAEKFFAEKLGKALQDAKIVAQPTFFQVHNIMKP